MSPSRQCFAVCLRQVTAIATCFLVATTACALPTTTVHWQNLGDGTPENLALLDHDGVTPLTAGSAAGGDGAVLVLGYFKDGDGTDPFSGTWVPLTGPVTANTSLRTTSIGDNLPGASGPHGFFAMQTDFDLADPSTSQVLPPAGTQLAVAIFNRATFAASTHCTIATNDAWRWVEPQMTPGGLDIKLNDPGTVWFGGTERVAAMPVAQFPGYPVIANSPANQGLEAGTPLAFTPTVGGAAGTTLQWYKNGAAIPGATSATLDFGATKAADSGTYVLRASNAAGIAEARVKVAVHTAPARLINLSTRGPVGTGDALLIPGFYVRGPGPKQVLIRAVGPTLTNLFGLAGALANPRLSIRNAQNVELAANDDWGIQPNADLVAAAFSATGAYQLPNDSADAALLFAAPGETSLSVHVTGAGGATGIAVAEIFVVDDQTSSGSRLINLSTRGFVGTGDNVMIPGFYLSSGGARRLLIRAAGPGLAKLAPGLAPILPDPVLRVRRVPSGQEVAFNDDWQDGSQGAAIAAAAAEVWAFAFADGSMDAALILEVGPAVPDANDRGFTIEVSDANGATGLAIAEIYELP